jgi:hypothetical protein
VVILERSEVQTTIAIIWESRSAPFPYPPFFPVLLPMKDTWQLRISMVVIKKFNLWQPHRNTIMILWKYDIVWRKNDESKSVMKLVYFLDLEIWIRDSKFSHEPFCLLFGIRTNMKHCFLSGLRLQIWVISLES